MNSGYFCINFEEDEANSELTIEQVTNNREKWSYFL